MSFDFVGFAQVYVVEALVTATFLFHQDPIILRIRGRMLSPLISRLILAAIAGAVWPYVLATCVLQLFEARHGR